MTDGYICGLCGYATHNKQSFKRHMARKFPCSRQSIIQTPDEENINETKSEINHNGTIINTNGTVEKATINEKICDMCGKEFKNVNTCRAHRSRGTCKKEKVNPCQCTRCLRVFKNPNSKRSHMSRNSCVSAIIPVPSAEVGASRVPSVQITGDNNTVNNNVTIVVNNYGDENTGYISQDEAALVKAIRAGPEGLQNIIRRIYFNDAHPENRTVQEPNLARQLCQTWDASTETWKFKPIDDVTYDMMYKAAKPLHEFYRDRNTRDRGFENITKAIQSSPARSEENRSTSTAQDRKVYRKLVKATRCTLLNSRGGDGENPRDKF